NILVQVTDDDTGTDFATTNLIVTNVAPVISPNNLHLSTDSVTEGGSVTLTGSFADVSPLDTHTVVIAWGDGSTSNAAVNPLTRTFSATHQFVDDNPTGTSSDTYNITASVTDDDTGSGSASI